MTMRAMEARTCVGVFFTRRSASHESRDAGLSARGLGNSARLGLCASPRGSRARGRGRADAIVREG